MTVGLKATFFSQIYFALLQNLFRNQKNCFINLASASNGHPAHFSQLDDHNFSSNKSNTSQLIFNKYDDQDISSRQSNTSQLIFSQSDDQDFSSSQSNTSQLIFSQSDDQDSSSQSNTSQLIFSQLDDQDSSSQSNTSQLIFSKSEDDNMSTSQQVNIQTEADDVYSFIPVISCIFICFGYGFGLGPIPFILFGELFPSKTQFLFFIFQIYLVNLGEVRGIMSSITGFLRSITVFVSIKVCCTSIEKATNVSFKTKYFNFRYFQCFCTTLELEGHF